MDIEEAARRSDGATPKLRVALWPLARVMTAFFGASDTSFKFAAQNGDVSSPERQDEISHVRFNCACVVLLCHLVGGRRRGSRLLRQERHREEVAVADLAHLLVAQAHALVQRAQRDRVRSAHGSSRGDGRVGQGEHVGKLPMEHLGLRRGQPLPRCDPRLPLEVVGGVAGGAPCHEAAAAAPQAEG